MNEKKGGGAAGAMPGYPIPANDKVLKTEHLRALALFVVQQAGLMARDGGYGFVRPAPAGGRGPNDIIVEKGQVRVEGLAVLSRHGIAIVGDPPPLRLNDGRPFTLLARWKLPPHAPDNATAPAEVTLARQGDGGAYDAEVELAHISPVANPPVLLRAPLLSIDATKQSAAAARALRDRLAKLGPLIEAASRENPSARGLVGAELRSAAQSVDPSPLAVLERVAAILRQCAMIVRLEEGDSAELVIALERASTLRPTTDDGFWPASAWIDWIDGACRLLDIQGALVAWLRGPHGQLSLAGVPKHHAADIYSFSYALDGISATELRLTVTGDEALRAPVQFRLDQGILKDIQLQASGDGFEARIAVGDAKLIEILAPKEIKPVLHF